MDYAAVEYTLRPGNNPDPARFSDLDMPAMLGGRERTPDHLERLYADSGFRLTRIVPAPSGFGVIERAPV